MIAPLRKWHRRAMFALVPLVLAIFIAGLLSRHEPLPANPALSVHGKEAP